MTRRRVVLAGFVLAVMVGAALLARPYVHGLSFVVRAADMQGIPRELADLDTARVSERELEIPVTGQPLRARAYEPPGALRRTALLVSGLHPSGIDQPRLVRLARELAASGIGVVTPDIPELSRFEITPAITDGIEHAAVWLASDPRFAPDGRVGLMGISFSGGLSIVAAGRPSLRDRVAYAFAFGGHHDLPRVLQYLCSGVSPRPATLPLTPERNRPLPAPHDYGVAVIMLGAADKVAPHAQVDRLRTSVRRYLWASALDGGVDKSQAPREFAAVRDSIKTLPEPSATLLRYVVDRDVVHLGPRLSPYIKSYGGDPALSASKSPKPSAPVFLLHGLDDNVIPSIESEFMADDLRGSAPVRLLLSGLITHAEADRPARFGDVMRLAGFWGDLLGR